MEEEIKKLEEKIYENTKKINENLERINQNSYALGILKDYKRAARRWFIAFIIVTILLTLVCIHHFIIE